MPIAPLPEDAHRAISSSQVLTDSASVVKELVDNALDAQASSIVVEVSLNALDVIQVKDNGHGIAPEDRSLLCQRHCTSKIRDLKDVSNLGGTSLGFRGEALASAVEMSNCVTVSTRIEGEPVASALKFGGTGKLLSDNRVSHPVGTTVRVADFLKHTPVRKQTALKETSKTFLKIKAVLKAYALARPKVRLSLKILNAKNDKDHWTYASKPGSTVIDAATKIIGQQVVGQCEWHVWPPLVEAEITTATTTSTPISISSKEAYSLEALLPRSQCDVTTISNTGQYLSVDSRPVSYNRDTFKQIITLYKSYLRSSCSIDSHQKLTEPFLCLNIKCPSGSYDPNVEPAKDDVIFTDAETVLMVTESFLKHVYGEKKTPLPKNKVAEFSEYKRDCFEVLLNRKPVISVSEDMHHDCRDRSFKGRGRAGEISDVSNSKYSIVSAETLHMSVPNSRDLPLDAPSELYPTARSSENFKACLVDSSSPGRRAWESGMSNGDEEDDYKLEGIDEIDLVTEEAADEESIRNIALSNPWTIAKLNAPVRKLQPLPTRTSRTLDCDKHLLTPTTTGPEVYTHSLYFEPIRPYTSRLEEAKLPSPLSSPASTLQTADIFSSPTRMLSSTSPWAKARDRTEAPRPTGPPQSISSPEIDGVLLHSDNVPRDGFISARILQKGTSLSEIPNVSQRQRNQQLKQGAGVHKPFVSPVNRNEIVLSESIAKNLFQRPQNRRPQNIAQADISSLILSEDGDNSVFISKTSSANSVGILHPDLAATMDFENRKQAAIQKRRAQLHQQTLDRVVPRWSESQVPLTNKPNSPHKNRYNKAVAALSSSELLEGPLESTFEKGDPRSYLAQDMKTEGKNPQVAGGSPDNKLKRRKTAHLPFECVPVDQALHNLVVTTEINAQDLQRGVARLAAYDEYVSSAGIADAFDCTVHEARSWDELLRNIPRISSQSPLGGGVDVLLDTWAALQKHRISHRPDLIVLDA